jgi:hypothetical protein
VLVQVSSTSSNEAFTLALLRLTAGPLGYEKWTCRIANQPFATILNAPIESPIPLLGNVVRVELLNIVQLSMRARQVARLVIRGHNQKHCITIKVFHFQDECNHEIQADYDALARQEAWQSVIALRHKVNSLLTM